MNEARNRVQGARNKTRAINHSSSILSENNLFALKFHSNAFQSSPLVLNPRLRSLKFTSNSLDNSFAGMPFAPVKSQGPNHTN